MDRPHSLMLNKDRNSDVQKYFEEKGFTIKIGEESSVAFIKRSSGETIDVAGGDKMFDMTMMVTDL